MTLSEVVPMKRFAVLLALVVILASACVKANAMSLHDSIQNDDLGALQQLLASPSAAAQLEVRDARGRTPLLLATTLNRVAMAEALIRAGADVNAKDAIKDSPYLVAGAEGRVDILRMILASGRADLNSTNRYGGTALIPAAEKGHPEAVALLIEAGIAIDHVNDLGWTALLEAVILTAGGPVHQKIVRMLLEAGADPSIPDMNGVTALDHARLRGYTAMVLMLEEAGR